MVELDITMVAIAVIIGIVSLTATRILRKSHEKIPESELIFKRREKLMKDYVGDLEEDNEALKKEIKSLKNTENRRQRGPEYDEDMGLEELIPTFVGDLSQFVPKKLQPFFKNTELQQVIIKKVLDNPEKYKPLIDKFVNKATGKKDGNENPIANPQESV